MLLSLFSIIVFANMSFAPQDTVTIISSYSYLYEDASFTSEKIKNGENDLILYHGQNVEVIEESGDFLLVNVILNQIEYEGYIYKYYVTKNNSQVVYPVFNGMVKTDNAIIYDIELNPTQYTATKNQKIYIYGAFDDDYTAIQIVLQDGSLYNGYIKTSDIYADGVSSLLIVGITIIIACVTIILSLVFIKKRKKK